MKKILITGGAGFIGSNLARLLTQKGYFVRVLDSLSQQIHGNTPRDSALFRSLPESVEFIYGDVRKREDWKHSIEGIDWIVHLAAETGTGQSMYQISRYSDVNISGTALLLDILINEKNTVKKILVASSRAIYGEGKYRCQQHGIIYPEGRNQDEMGRGLFEPMCPQCKLPMEPIATDEISRSNPSSVYAITKKTQEELVLMFGKVSGIATMALRYQNVYGPGQSLKNPYTGILSIFSTNLLAGKTVEIFEDGHETRDFAFIDDITSATVKALECDNARDLAINIGSGQPTQIMQVAFMMKQLYKSKSEIKVTGRFRVGDIRHNYADLGLAKEIIGLVPSVSFEEGLLRFVTWVKAQPLEPDRYSASIEELSGRGLYK